MGDESTTESSETESLEDYDDDEAPEDRDHLVADLYKHMEERGTPINRTPTIGNRELDLYKLIKLVTKMGGCQRVTNNNLWRQVGMRLGFETTWCFNQVRVYYTRNLKSYEDMNKHLGVTMKNTPTTTSRSRRSSGTAASRAAIRGKNKGTGKTETQQQQGSEESSDKSSIEGSSQEEKTESPVPSGASDSNKKAEEAKDDVVEEKKKGKHGSKQKTPTRPDAKMTTRPRRDSTSSLAAAMQVKAQKDTIGEDSRRPVVRMDRDKETENEAKKLKAKSPKTERVTVKEEASKEKRKDRDKERDKEKEKEKEKEKDKEEKEEKEKEKEESREKKESSAPPPDPLDRVDRDRREPRGPGGKKKLPKKKGKEEDVAEPSLPPEDPEAKQHLPPGVEVLLGDKIKVFYKSNTIYEAKVIKVQTKEGEKWPRYQVHYQGWNARYDEWIWRSKIAENMSWSKDREKTRPTASAAVAQEPPSAEVAPTAPVSEAWTTRKEEKKEPPPATPKEKVIHK